MFLFHLEAPTQLFRLILFELKIPCSLSKCLTAKAATDPFIFTRSATKIDHMSQKSFCGYLGEFHSLNLFCMALRATYNGLVANKRLL